MTKIFVFARSWTYTFKLFFHYNTPFSANKFRSATTHALQNFPSLSFFFLFFSSPLMCDALPHPHAHTQFCSLSEGGQDCVCRWQIVSPWQNMGREESIATGIPKYTPPTSPATLSALHHHPPLPSFSPCFEVSVPSAHTCRFSSHSILLQSSCSCSVNSLVQ